MIYLISALFFFSILTVNAQNGNSEGEPIVILGKAQNAKAGAVVLTPERKVYYLEGIDSWDTEMLGKEVEVTGQLKVETFRSEDLQNENGEWVQGMVGEKLIILKPEWKAK